MNYRKSLKQMIGLALVVLLLVGCGAPTGTPTPIPPTATPTPVPPTATPIPTTGGIKGRVFRSDTNEPIANVHVSLSDATNGVSEIITDAQGYYSFAEVKPGEYGLKVVLELKDLADSPCPPVGIFVYERHGDSFQGFVTRERDGDFLNVILMYLFSVAAGDLVQKDFDLYCE